MHPLLKAIKTVLELSSCVLVAHLFIGKRVIKGDQGDQKADIKDVCAEATELISACYGSQHKDNMSEVRCEV